MGSRTPLHGAPLLAAALAATLFLSLLLAALLAAAADLANWKGLP